MQRWQCRWAPSLGELEGTHQEVWGTKEYENDTDPTVFFGLYGLPDFYALWKHKGRKAILWAGSDITHFKNGYWLDDVGETKLDPKGLAEWINTNCENYVENQIEQRELEKVGIKVPDSNVVPSFLGKIDDYKVSYEWSDRPKLYTSVSGDNFELYGWDKISDLANKNENVEFHLYGNTKNPLIPAVYHNVIVHGRVPKEQMNAEIKKMQGALRLTEFDGFSEILAKSILWGQWPVSLIKYPFMLGPKDIWVLTTNNQSRQPNHKGREFYRKILNDYPWNAKKH